MKAGHRIIKKYRSLDLGKKILVMLLTVSIIPICVILALSYRLSSSIITRQTRELIRENLEQSAGNVENFFEKYDSMIQSIYIDNSYMENLKLINAWDASRYYLAKHDLQENLQNLTYMNREILGIAIIGNYGDICVYDNITSSGERSFCFDTQNIKNSQLIKQAFAENHCVYSSLYHQADENYGEYSYFYIAHRLTDFNNYKKGAVGCIVLCVDEKALNNTYGQSSGESNITFVVDRSGNILSFPRTEGDEGGKTGKEHDSIFLAGGERHTAPTRQEIEEAAQDYIRRTGYFGREKLVVDSIEVQDGAFYVVNVQDLNYSLSNLRYLLIMVCLIGMAVGVLCVLIALLTSDDTNRSVKRILRAMNEANKGNLDVRIEPEGSDEFARISDHFNHMIGEIRKSNMQEREAMIREKNAEIRSLEAQINPHFLYNTLDTINWTAIDKQEYSISQMLTSLAKILRYSISNSNEIVAVKSELEYLKKYIYLQQQRFNYSFMCTVHVPDELLECRIHKLLLQPLIENTIIHGFEEMTELGEIDVDIRAGDRERIRITVRDNGKGMDQDLVKLFNNYDYRKDKIETSIGVRNVITRIKLYYGEKGSFHMESGSGGTTAVIVIPIE